MNFDYKLKTVSFIGDNLIYTGFRVYPLPFGSNVYVPIYGNLTLNKKKQILEDIFKDFNNEI